MNRDESRIRDESGTLQKTESTHGTKSVYPKDLKSNGSWFGANDCGVVLALLNRYQDSLKQDVISRGTIIPKALSLGGPQEIVNFCRNLKINKYNPFDLILVSNETCYRFKWNGTDYHISPFNLEKHYFITSSSVDMEKVLITRAQKFKAWMAQFVLEELTDNKILREFHLKQTTNKSHSVYMEREFSHTKSICQAIIGSLSSQIYYMPFLGSVKTAKTVKSKSMKQTVILPFISPK